jgi:excisionase family DNA binding protein
VSSLIGNYDNSIKTILEDLMSDKSVLTTFEAAAMCNVSYNTIKNWIKRGLLDAYRTAGGHLRIKFKDLEGFSGEYGVPIQGGEGLGRRKILIIDGSGFINVFCESFNNQKDMIDVKAATDAFEAGALLESMKPDIVILDSAAVGMDGVKMCNYIRKSPSLKHAKVVVVIDESGSGFLGDKISCDLRLTKPVNKVALVESIEPFLAPKKGVRGRKRKNS